MGKHCADLNFGFMCMTVEVSLSAGRGRREKRKRLSTPEHTMKSGVKRDVVRRKAIKETSLT